MTAQPITRRRRGLTEEAADAAIDQACRMLRLPTIRSQFPDTAQGSTRQQLSYRAFLAELLLSECDDRALRRSERRLRAVALTGQIRREAAKQLGSTVRRSPTLHHFKE